MKMYIKKIIIKDNLKDLENIIKTLRSKTIKIGIFGADDSQLLMIAKVNEFGVDIKITPKMRRWLHVNGLHVKKSTRDIHIPERSFIRRTAAEKKNKIDEFIKQQMTELLTFQISVETFFDRVGTYLVGLTQETLTEINTPPNHPFTLERKKPKSKPLINTGRLRGAITYKIE